MSVDLSPIKRLRRERHGPLSGDKPLLPAFSDESCFAVSEQLRTASLCCCMVTMADVDRHPLAV